MLAIPPPLSRLPATQAAISSTTLGMSIALGARVGADRRGGHPAVGMRRSLATLALVLAFAMLGGLPANACGWWDCSDGYRVRQPTRVYGYYRSVRPGTPVPALSRLDLLSAPPIPGGNGALLITPGAMPGPGPSLFGPPPAPPRYYRAPSARKWHRRSR